MELQCMRVRRFVSVRTTYLKCNMRCKHCHHKIVFRGGNWYHWNDSIHPDDCLCINPFPKEKVITDFA